MKTTNFIATLCASLLLLSLSTYAQNAQKAERKQAQIQQALQEKEAVENRSFVFYADEAQPMGWRNIHLSYGYFLKVSPDTIQAYLPYYGRAYRASTNPDESGIKFCSTDFDYKAGLNKKGGYEIEIAPKDLVDKRYTLRILIFPGGNSHLTVTDPDRQTISFDGNIECR